MKDDRLEKEFEEYFKGASAPDDITRDAKKYVKPKYAFMPKFVKFASIAASFIVVCALALTFILRNNRVDSPSDDAAIPPSVVYYTDTDLETKAASAYSASRLDPSLKFIQNFALASNADVEKFSAGYKDGKLTLVKAEVNILNGLSRDDTEIYVEYTDKNHVYFPLSDYSGGERHSYRGAEYYLTANTCENGEPEYKLHVLYGGVKFYFSVRSSDTKAYAKYLNMVIKNNF